MKKIYAALKPANPGKTFKNYLLLFTACFVMQFAFAQGNAISLNGTNQYGKVTMPAIGYEYTVEAWVLPQATTGAMEIFSTRGTSDFTFDMKLQNGNKVHADIGDGTKWITTAADADFNYKAGQWVHIACSVSLSAGRYYIFINGNQAATGTISAGYFPLFDASHTTGYIGANAGTSEFFKGSIDELKIYGNNTGAVLSQDRVRADMVSESLLASYGLLYYNFNHSPGAGLNDASGYGHHGTLVGGPVWAESYAMVLPQIADAIYVNASGFRAQWLAPAKGTVTDYYLDVSATADFAARLTGYDGLKINGATFKDVTGLQDNKQYYYRVRADKGGSVAGQGCNSQTAGVLTGNPVPMPPPGNALNFDGVDDHVRIRNLVTNDFTIEFWMRTTQTGAGSQGDQWRKGTGIVDASDVRRETYVDERDYGISLVGGKICYGTGRSYPSLGSLSEHSIYSQSTVNTGHWVHVAAVRHLYTHIRGPFQVVDAIMKLYINGVLEASYDLGDGTQRRSPNVVIGANNDLSHYFNGSIDELTFFDNEKTPDEIKADMQGRPDPADFHTFAYFNFDEGTAGANNPGVTELVDLSRHRISAPLNNFALTAGQTSNWVASAAMVIPVSAPPTHIHAAGFTANWVAPLLNDFDNYSLEVATKPDFSAMAPGYPKSIAKNITSYAVTGLTPNAYYYRVSTSKNSIPGQGAHTASVPVLFIGNFSPTTAIAGSTITIKGSGFTGATAVKFGGIGAQSFNVVSDDEISAVLGGGATGTISVTTPVGTAVSQAIFTCTPAAAPGYALNFDGVDDHVTIPWTITGDFTIEYWMRTTQTGPGGTQWHQGAGLVDGEVSGLENDLGTSLLGSKLCFGYGDKTGGFGDVSIISKASVNTGQWVHVAVVRVKATGAMQIYINGMLDTTGHGGVNALDGTARLCLGQINTNINRFNGSLDELRIFNTARNGQQVAADMLNVIGNPAADATLVSYYNFDQGTPSGNNANGYTTLIDLSSNKNNGTLHNFALTGATSNWVASYAIVLPALRPATNVLATSFTANWSAPTVGSFTDYYVDVSTTPDFSSFVTGYNRRNVTGATSLLVDGLNSSTRYYYRVSANKTGDAAVAGQGGYLGYITVKNIDFVTATIKGNAVVCENAVQPQVTFAAENGATPYTFTYKINHGENKTITSTGTDTAAILPAPTSASGQFMYSLVHVADKNGKSLALNDSITITVVKRQNDTSFITIDTTRLPYTWNGGAYNASGTYAFHAINSGGCDSISALVLRVTQQAPLPFNYTAPGVLTGGVEVNLAPNVAAFDNIIATFNINGKALGADPLGNVYVYDGVNFKKISSDGSVTTIFTVHSPALAEAGFKPGQALVLTADANGYIYIANQDLNKIVKVSPGAAKVTVLAPAYRWSFATDIAVNRRGYVFVIDYYHLVRIEPDGITVQTNLQEYSRLDYPSSLSIDFNYDILCVSDPYNGIFYGVYSYPITTGRIYAAMITIDNNHNFYGSDGYHAGKIPLHGSATAFAQDVSVTSIKADAVGGVYFLNAQTGILTKYTGGSKPAHQYSIAPALPAGLEIDPASGVISGAPLAASHETGYTVKASNNGGTEHTILTLKTTRVDTAVVAVCTSELPYHWNGRKYDSTGIYHIKLNDINNVDSLAVLNFTVNANPTAVLSTPSGSDTACYGKKKEIVVNASGGGEPYRYSLDSVTYQPGKAFFAGSGPYKAFVKDANGCAAVTNTLTLIRPKQPITTDYTVGLIDCGSVSAKSTGGYGGYTYSIDDSAYQTRKVFSGLLAGVYTLSTKDKGGCINTVKVTIKTLGAKYTTPATAICYGSTVATSVDGRNGAGTYKFSIDSGKTYQLNNVFKVGAGTYSIFVRDGEGCTGTSNSLTITQPAAPLAADNAVQNVSCHGGNDGTDTITASGSYGDYMYSLNGDSGYQALNLFTGLTAGTYKMAVKDANGCTLKKNVVITQPETPCFAAPAPISPTSAKVDKAGTLKVTVSPNPAPVEFTLQIVNGNDKKIVELRVMDMLGKTVYHTTGSVYDMYKFGRTFAGGMYIAEIINGDKVQTIKLVKSN